MRFIKLTRKVPSFNKTYFIALMGILLVPAHVSAQEKPAHWSYNEHGGPNEWGKLDSYYAACSSGKTQSPIDIRDAKKADLPALKFNYSSSAFNIIDNGHTIQVNYSPGSTLVVGNKTYTLKQFHFHHPSEEHVNGHTYDMVAHLVHADDEGRLAVVAVLFEKGKTNDLINLIWKNIPKEKEKPTDVAGATVNAADLLPTGHGYYTFAGSLTTPPCSEGVTWYVMKNPVSLSEAQVGAFAKLYPTNARPIQASNGREILESQ